MRAFSSRRDRPNYQVNTGSSHQLAPGDITVWVYLKESSEWNRRPPDLILGSVLQYLGHPNVRIACAARAIFQPPDFLVANARNNPDFEPTP